MFSPVFVDVDDTTFVYASSNLQFYVVEQIVHTGVCSVTKSRGFGPVSEEFVSLYKKYYRIDLDPSTLLAKAVDTTYEVAEPQLLVTIDPEGKTYSELNLALYNATEYLENILGPFKVPQMIFPILALLTKDAFNSAEIPHGNVVVQDKLDGNRLLVHLGSKMAYTRNHKIKFRAELMTEIWPQLKHIRNIYNLGLHLDGELYKPNGQSSDVSGRLNSLNLRFDGLCYNIFGFYDDNNRDLNLHNMHKYLPKRLVTAENRDAMLLRYTKPDYSQMVYSPVNFVFTSFCNWPEDKEKIRKFYEDAIDQHYREGLMVYIGDKCYPNNTTRDCIYKIKNFDEIVIKVIGVVDAKGQEKGCAVFVLENGQRIRPSMTFNERREILNNPSMVIGRDGVFKYSVSTESGVYRDMTFVRWHSVNDEL